MRTRRKAGKKGVDGRERREERVERVTNGSKQVKDHFGERNPILMMTSTGDQIEGPPLGKH
jgi:hypothetical protein